jgi:hypothetical protein
MRRRWSAVAEVGDVGVEFGGHGRDLGLGQPGDDGGVLVLAPRAVEHQRLRRRRPLGHLEDVLDADRDWVRWAAVGPGSRLGVVAVGGGERVLV